VVQETRDLIREERFDELRRVLAECRGKRRELDADADAREGGTQ
jgi:hypothetical protein